jgi:eukaryotic-like serine/threonine-protein kinase
MRLSPKARAAVCLGLAALLFAAVAPLEAQEPAKDWSSFRNNFQLTGIAGTSLPEKLEVLWKVPAPFGVNSTAAIVGGKVYIGTINGDFLCLDKKSGEKVWDYRSIDDPDPAAFAPAFKCSPTVTKDAIYIGDEDGVFHCLDPKTGKRKWKFHTNGEIISSPSLVGEKVIFGSYDNTLYCLNKADGKKIWSFETDGYVHCSPAIAGNFTFVTGCDEHLRVINIESGKEEGNLPLATYMIASPALVGESLYFGTYGSEVLSVNWKTREVEWRYRDEKKEFPYHSSAAVTEDFVVVGGRDKQVHCINRKTGKGVWKFATNGRKGQGGRVDSSPVILGERVFVGSSDGNLYELGLKDGKEVAKYPIGKEVTASPAIGEGVLVIGAEGSDEFIYCFGKKEK